MSGNTGCPVTLRTLPEDPGPVGPWGAAAGSRLSATRRGSLCPSPPGVQTGQGPLWTWHPTSLRAGGTVRPSQSWRDEEKARGHYGHTDSSC